ncbi:MAG: OB-fold nucleic acid binding domain-containing protein, partial [Rikenellaceae bacterium]
NAQQSLFGGDCGNVDIQRPLPPSVLDWGDLETLHKERDVIGLFLSAHPLDQYEVIIKKMCKSQLSELNNLEELNGQEVGFAGMVTSVQNLTTKTGKPWGRFTMEDYNGTHEFALFGKDYEAFRKYLFVDYFLFVRGKVQPHPYRERELELKLLSMVQLSEMMDTSIKDLTIVISEKVITREFIAELSENVNKSKGNISLKIKVFDPQTGASISLFSKRKRVTLSKELVGFLEDNDIHYTIN